MATNHPKYYFSDGNLLFQAGRRRFRIHRYLLEGSTLARKLLPTERDPLKGFDASECRPLSPNTDDGAFEAFLDVLYHPGGVEPGTISTTTLIAAFDVAEDYRATAISKRIIGELVSRKTDGTLEFSFAMLKCYLRHSNRLPRSFAVEHFTSICMNRGPIKAAQLENIGRSMVAMIIEGRCISSNPKSVEWSTSGPLSVKMGIWPLFLQRVFPSKRSYLLRLLELIVSFAAALLAFFLRIVCQLGRLLMKGAPRKSKRFYFRDGNILCQAEYTQYRGHQYLFRNSTLDINLPLPQTYPAESLERDNPIPLPGIRAAQFEALLEVMYLPPFSDPHLLSNPSLITALDIADRYALDDVCIRITGILKSKDHKVTLQGAFDMLACCLRHPSRFPREEVIKIFTAICTRPTIITEKHLEGVDMQIVAHIIRGRQTVLRGVLGARIGSNWPSNWPIPKGWDGFMAKTFPVIGTEGGWRVRQDKAESERR